MERNQLIAIVIVVIVIVGAGIANIFLQQPTLEVEQVEQPKATMTADGIFDRIELFDRHYGDWNGQEVEGALLAVLYESGTTNITEKHYEGRFTETYTNFCFFLYVYYGTEHLRERISIMGGDVREYIFINVTITVSLNTTIIS